ncbi:hypothetical protein BH09ACT5_BH09ACT5_03810 [soil metagenome]
MTFRSRLRAFWEFLKNRRAHARAPRPALVDRFCETLNQGMVMTLDRVPELRNGRVFKRVTPHGVVIVSQTCDVVQPKIRTLVVAVVRKLSHEKAAEAANGSQPRYVPLPRLGVNYFADLDHIATIAKSEVMRLDVQQGLSDHVSEARKFSARVGRRYSRYAFPDVVAPWLSPLRSIVSSRATAEDALKKAADLILELRVQPTSWDEVPVDLTLHVILAAGELPELFEELAVPSPEIAAHFNVPRKPKYIAELLFPADGERPTGDDRQYLWDQFGDALARLCVPSNRDRAIPGVSEAVRSVDALVASMDDFTLLQYRKSEQLDLAHLSYAEPEAP